MAMMELRRVVVDVVLCCVVGGCAGAACLRCLGAGEGGIGERKGHLEMYEKHSVMRPRRHLIGLGCGVPWSIVQRQRMVLGSASECYDVGWSVVWGKLAS